ncbi:hypothetical protein GQ53DRAFT_99972 [Thozetella sp. PMI_491]|nr:hypothetical protein GQ53DRAFT_99972 [Thozetella sp. PMI_491]
MQVRLAAPITQSVGWSRLIGLGSPSGGEEGYALAATAAKRGARPDRGLDVDPRRCLHPMLQVLGAYVPALQPDRSRRCTAPSHHMQRRSSDHATAAGKASSNFNQTTRDASRRVGLGPRRLPQPRRPSAGPPRMIAPPGRLPNPGFYRRTDDFSTHPSPKAPASGKPIACIPGGGRPRSWKMHPGDETHSPPLADGAGDWNT